MCGLTLHRRDIEKTLYDVLIRMFVCVCVVGGGALGMWWVPIMGLA